MIRFMLFATALAALAAPAAAQSRWYAGVSAGASKTNSELVFNRESTITESISRSTDFDDRDRAWKAYAGFRLNSVIALEASYADLGEHRMLTTTIGGDPVGVATIDIRRKVKGYGVDIVATAPLGLERFRLFGRAGAFRTTLDASAQLEGNIIFTNNPDARHLSVRQHETVFRTGLGMEWQLARNLALRAEYERFAHIGVAFAIGRSGTTGEADTDMASIGVVATF
jgi:opacity protein-like surface antigen